MTTVSWVSQLKASIEKNYGASVPSTKRPVMVPATFLTTQTTTTGSRSSSSNTVLRPTISQLHFHDFLNEDPRLLVFSAPIRNAEVMSGIKSGGNTDILWQFPNSQESFIISGRLYPIAESYRVGKPPRKHHLAPFTATNPVLAYALRDTSDAEEYWEKLRLDMFNRSSDLYRARLTWPAPGSIMEDESERITHQLMANANVDRNVPLSPKGSRPGSPLQVKTWTGMEYGLNIHELSLKEKTDRNNASSSQSDIHVLTPSPSTRSSFSSISSIEKTVSDHQCALNAALDNFLLCVLKPTRIDVTRGVSLFPSHFSNKETYAEACKREIWDLDEEKGEYMKSIVHPFC